MKIALTAAIGTVKPNESANQHFISQVEQRLNALNPGARPQNQRIYSWSLVDREACSLSLDSSRGRKIVGNLSFLDLFSFEVAGRRDLRYNFETLFHQYESLIETDTRSLLSKLEQGSNDLKKEVIGLFAAKLVNFLRNPYSIRKVLNNFHPVLQFQPAYKYLLQDYQAVIGGQKPHQEYLCKQLGISQGEYQAWLAALFMLLARVGGSEELNMMEAIIKALFEQPSLFPFAIINRYTPDLDGSCCLLSHRGYCEPLPADQVSFSFNLCSHAFITYILADIDSLPDRKYPAWLVELYKKQSPKEMTVMCAVDNLPALRDFNRNVANQCHSKVYSSTASIYGLR